MLWKVLRKVHLLDLHIKSTNVSLYIDKPVPIFKDGRFSCFQDKKNKITRMFPEKISSSNQIK